MALDLSFRDPREPLGLAPLPFDEHDVEPTAHVGLRPLDRLRDRLLPSAQPLGDLVDRAPALHRLRLELVERLRDRLAGGPLELLPKTQHGLPLLVGRGTELSASRSSRLSTSAIA